MTTIYGLGSLGCVDDKDSRREIFFLLQHLDANERIQFLKWASDLSNFKRQWQGPQVYVLDTTEGHVAETYFDLMALSVHYGLDLLDVLPELERRARLKLLAIV